MGAERIGAALGMGAKKSIFFIKPGPVCLSNSSAGPDSVPGRQERDLGSSQI